MGVMWIISEQITFPHGCSMKPRRVAARCEHSLGGRKAGSHDETIPPSWHPRLHVSFLDTPCTFRRLGRGRLEQHLVRLRQIEGLRVRLPLAQISGGPVDFD